MLVCMASDWSFSAPVLMNLLAGLGITSLACWIRGRHPFAGSSAFTGMHLAILWWLGAAALEMSFHAQGCKMFWAAMAWPAILAVPTFWALFLWQYLNSIRTPLKLRAILVLGSMPMLFWLLALTNPWHGLFYGPASAPISAEANAPVRYEHGVLFYLAAAYVYPFMLFCIGVMVRAAIVGKGVHRQHYLMFVVLTTVPLLANISYVALGWTLFGFDPTPFSFSITLAGFGWLISGLQLFDLMPVARHLLVDALIDPVLVIDPRHRVIEANPAALQLAKLDRDWQGRPLANWPMIGPILEGMVRQAGPAAAEPGLLNVEMNQQHFEVRLREISRSTCEGKVVLGQMLYLRDITQFQRSQMQLADALALSKQQLASISNLLDTLQDQALRDPLTGLFNRRYLEEYFASVLARAQRGATLITVAMVDLDHFKGLNDTHGHGAGDDSLKGVATFLLNTLRATDTVFRIGGEEFLVVLTDTQPAEARKKLEQLCTRFASTPLETRVGPLRLTMSVGLAFYPSQATDLDGLMQQADMQLYRAKADGRNTVAASDFCAEGSLQ